MIVRTLSAVVLSIAALSALPGCAVTRGQSTVGEYVDDATLTTKVKAKFVESKAVDASSISVQTLNGEVVLSGFAKNSTERAEAERLAREIDGVKRVKNAIDVRQ